MTLTRFVWRIQTRCWSRARRCSTCGPLVRARGQRVSKSDFAAEFGPFAVHSAFIVFFSWLFLCVTAVESLYTALKSIDRMDIINMLEGQPPQPVRQGSRDLNRRRHNEREHLSPGITNGKLPPQIPWCSLFSFRFHPLFLKYPDAKGKFVSL